MSDIADLEKRLSAALDRISLGVDQISDSGRASAEVALTEQSQVREQSERIAELEAELAAERSAKSALEDRLKEHLTALTSSATASGNADVDALNKAHAEELEYLRSVAAAEREAWQGLNSRLVRMRRTNRLMRQTAATMRKAAEEKVVDAEAINQSLQVELEALQATQELERAETDVILKTLQPLLGDPIKDAEEAF